MGTTNRQCLCCGKKYNYCFRCDGGDIKLGWKNNYCSENCRTIFNVTASYYAKEINADEAKKAFAKCDLADKANFVKSIQKVIAEVIPAPKKVEKPVAEQPSKKA